MTKNSHHRSLHPRFLPVHFWIELALGTITAAASLLTLLQPTWIEVIFGADPDRSSGSAELLLLTSLVLATLTLSTLAVHTWKNAHA
jgi:hypothetical protein